MRTDWSKGYITHPDVRPEEQHRLVPRTSSDDELLKQYRELNGGGFGVVADGPTIVYPKQADPPTTVLDEAAEVIKERGENYDHPLPNHERIAALWSVVLGTTVTPLQVVQCMIAVKLARLIATPEHRDSLVDLCGYAACAEQIIGSRRD